MSGGRGESSCVNAPGQYQFCICLASVWRVWRSGDGVLSYLDPSEQGSTVVNKKGMLFQSSIEILAILVTNSNTFNNKNPRFSVNAGEK